MLKGINPLISPELLKILSEMGHGDEIVFGDSNFPAAALAQRLVRADGLSITGLLEAILPLFPLDYAVDYAAVSMEYRSSKEPVVWSQYKALIGNQPEGDKPFLTLSKPAFYARASKAYCVVATGESESFANLILRKGIVR
ncbi:MAG: L-fucose mutarotase [Dysgonamonadaceae bacterium]|jgi:L-fucose mutarotase|nr:L-fucose mutarotase [Dysgonamonadaceae bacterium]